ncbi:hypothetical protein ZIOFF_002123 [Zingiber officinale]|uniref:Uncharacterized protein n=1 Tax=Zingiber officinale TaxID=94328 RepID=A0A8J5M8Q9_ZINOF|nr:hypothetical protein ZIOFF_002123 [Zingiber officinale]
MDEGYLDFSNPEVFSRLNVGEDLPSNCSMDSFFDNIFDDTSPGETDESAEKTFFVEEKVLCGHSDEDILRLAYEKYREENNDIAFNLEHVWRIIKDHPMFTPQSVDHLVGTKKARTSESGANNTSSNQDASLHVDLNEEETRPMDQKTAKRKGKGKMKLDIEEAIESDDQVSCLYPEMQGKTFGENGSYSSQDLRVCEIGNLQCMRTPTAKS